MGGDSESLELRVSEEELVYKFRFAFSNQMSSSI